MTEAEFLAKLAECVAHRDKESAHLAADELVESALESFGWLDAADAYSEARSKWWYA